MDGAGASPKAVGETPSPRYLGEHVEHPGLSHPSPLTRGRMVATTGGVGVEGEGSTALLGVAQTWTSTSAPLHAGLTPSHALGLPRVSMEIFLSLECSERIRH